MIVIYYYYDRSLQPSLIVSLSESPCKLDMCTFLIPGMVKRRVSTIIMQASKPCEPEIPNPNEKANRKLPKLTVG